MDIKSQINHHLDFLANFVNKKFGFIVGNYQTAYNLLYKCLPTQKILVSDLYYKFLLAKTELSLPFLPAKHDDSLNLALKQTGDFRGWLVADHFGGNPTNLNLIKSNQTLVEDISFGLGGQWANKNIGSFGLVSLLSLGTNLDLLQSKPKLFSLQATTKLFDPQAPVIILIKQFRLKDKLYLKMKELAIPPTTIYSASVLVKLTQIGRLIQNLEEHKSQNQIETRRIYRLNKDKFLPNIYPSGQPYFSFIACRP